MKPVGKPDSGKRHVRFDERRLETGRGSVSGPIATAPIVELYLRPDGRVHQGTWYLTSGLLSIPAGRPGPAFAAAP